MVNDENDVCRMSCVCVFNIISVVNSTWNTKNVVSCIQHLIMPKTKYNNFVCSIFFSLNSSSFMANIE